MTVELYDSHRDYSAPAGAKLVYNGGPLLKSVKLVGVYVDSFPFQQQMSAYLDFLATSDVLGELAEYGTGLGSHIGDYVISLSGGTPPPPPPPVPGPPPPPPPAPCPAGCVPAGKRRHRHSWLRILEGLRLKSAPTSTVVQDSDLQQLIADSIAASSLPAPDSETLYVLFLPSGVVVDMGSDASCTTFCGYHSNFTLSGGENVFYAILPYPDCDGCLGGLQAFDVLTATTSHEVCEAITDPIPGQGWYDQANGEIGDICAWQFRQDGQYNVQLEWSNSHNSCI